MSCYISKFADMAVIYEERGEGVSWDDYIGDDRGVS